MVYLVGECVDQSLMCSPILHVLYPSHAIALISITFISDIIVSNNIKVNTMDNLEDSELRLLKHPRWSPITCWSQYCKRPFSPPVLSLLHSVWLMLEVCLTFANILTNEFRRRILRLVLSGQFRLSYEWSYGFKAVPNTSWTQENRENSFPNRKKMILIGIAGKGIMRQQKGMSPLNWLIH